MAYSSELGSTSSETKKDDTTTESSKDTKKSSSSAANKLAGIATGTSLMQMESKPPAPEKQSGSLESLLKKLRGETAKPKEKPVPIFGIELPDGPQLEVKPKELPEKPGDSHAETFPKRDAETQIQDAELKQEIREIIVHGREDALGQMREMPLDQVDSPEAAEAATAYVLYSKMEDGIKSGETDLSQLPERAAESVAEQLSAELGADDDGTNQQGETSSEFPAPTATPEEDIESSQEDDTAAPAADAGAGPGFGAPGGPGGGGNSGNGNVPPFNPNGPPGSNPNQPNQPPVQPASFGQFPLGGPSNPNFAPAAANVAPNVIVGDERAAFGAGLLFGGLAGYFFGRHRGRKQGAATAERKARPIRKGLERQVQNLQESMSAKESQLKALAREKMQALQGKKDREHFVERILQSAPAESLAVATSRPAAEIVRAQQAANRGMVYSRSVESPLFPSGAEIPLARAGAIPEVVPFNKNVKEFSQQELMATAEKIKVQGTSLREMAELGRLDEPGLRRVVGEFLKGGDVTKAVSQEVKEKELQYEQDPRLRHHKDGQSGQASAQAMGAGGLVVGGLISPPSAEDTSTTLTSNFDGKHPEPDAATLKAIRTKQAVTIATTTVLIVLAIVLVIVLT